MRPQNEFINQVQQQLFSTIYLFFLSSMDSVFQQNNNKNKKVYNIQRGMLRWANFSRVWPQPK